MPEPRDDGWDEGHQRRELLRRQQQRDGHVARANDGARERQAAAGARVPARRALRVRKKPKPAGFLGASFWLGPSPS